jgi:hypothetical protein
MLTTIADVMVYDFTAIAVCLYVVLFWCRGMSPGSIQFTIRPASDFQSPLPADTQTATSTAVATKPTAAQLGSFAPLRSSLLAATLQQPNPTVQATIARGSMPWVSEEVEGVQQGSRTAQFQNSSMMGIRRQLPAGRDAVQQQLCSAAELRTLSEDEHLFAGTLHCRLGGF